jgi:hypothetical protein
VIVISGALVLVALVLLVLGLTQQDLNFVYGSIAVSLISFVFLVIGILQRRGEQPATAGAGADGDAGPPVTEGAAPPAQAVPAASAAKTGGAGSVPVGTAPVPTADDDEGEVFDDVDVLEPVGIGVLVVPGRPRYHVDGCRYLTGKAVEEVDVESAREQYSPCGVCKPEAAIEAMLAEPYDDEVVEEEEIEVEPAGAGVPVADEIEPTPEPVAPRRGGSRRADAASAAPTRSTGRATKAARSEPADDTAVAAGAAPAKAPARAGKVVVIPERGRFHTSSCRFVRDALGTEELTRTQAAKQGYKACGVCKP